MRHGMGAVAICLALVCGCCPAQSHKPLRVFISVDLEGVAGVVDPVQLGPSGFEYERARHLMTGEANAAVAGALDAGATEIVVSDGHGNGLSILPEELNPKAQLIRAWPRPLGMMDGIDRGFDAALLIGYHPSVGTPGGLLAHTISSSVFFDVRLNGEHASEAMISAADAGEFGVPVVLVSGGNEMVAEVHRTIDPAIIGVVVKRDIGFHSAESLSPQEAQTNIRAATTNALEHLSAVRPYRIPTPVSLELTFKNIGNAELFSYLPGVERENGSTIKFVGKDMVQTRKFLSFVSEVAH
ncbi:MAG: M55 family metallopeptidase [Acidobacteriaceae bacterium]